MNIQEVRQMIIGIWESSENEDDKIRFNERELYVKKQGLVYGMPYTITENTPCNCQLICKELNLNHNVKNISENEMILVSNKVLNGKEMKFIKISF